MPAWMHARAEHILAKNPSMPKSEAFAIATQQSHALGKSPKGYGTARGRAEAKKKYKTPEDDQKKAASMLVVLHKLAFSTNAFSGPMNPLIESGASTQAPPKRVSLQTGIQKMAELWPGFLAEMLKEAGPDLNVGQWWETVGGPFLAKGGDHKQFQKMMQDAGLPEGMQKKFMNVAKEKYTNATKVDYGAARNARSSWSGSAGTYEPPNPGYQGRARARWEDAWDDFHNKWRQDSDARRARWQEERAAREAEYAAAEAAEKAQVKKDFINPASMAGGAALAGTTAYGALAPQREDPRTKTHEWQGRLGNIMRGMGGAGTLGYLAGAATEQRGAGLIGAGIGALAGLPLGALMHQVSEQAAHDEARRAARSPGENRGQAMTRRAGMTTAAHMNAASPAILAESIGSGVLGGLSRQNAGIPLLLGAGRHVGIGLAGKRRAGRALEHFDRMQARANAPEADESSMPKAAAGAPTRGNFMMASDVPAFKAPRLDRGIQKEGDMSEEDVKAYAPSRRVSEEDLRTRARKEKNGDMLPDYVTYGAGDFKRSKYAAAELEHYVSKHAHDMTVAELRELCTRIAQEQVAREQAKHADVSPAVTWNGGTGNPHRMASDIPPFRAPRLDRTIQKEGSTSPAMRLHQSQSVGAPKASAPPGPSIADQAKPKGAKFGIGIPGAFKTGI